MGIIQNAINQTIGTAAMAARLGPRAEMKQQQYKEETALKRYEAQMNAFGKAEVEGEEQPVVQQMTKLQENIAETSERIALVSPTKKNIEYALKQKEYLNNLQGQSAEANKKAAEIQEAQRQQKERHKQYVAFVEKFTEGGLYK